MQAQYSNSISMIQIRKHRTRTQQATVLSTDRDGTNDNSARPHLEWWAGEWWVKVGSMYMDHFRAHRTALTHLKLHAEELALRAQQQTPTTLGGGS